MSQFEQQDISAYYAQLGSRLDPLERRLAREHMQVQALCETHSGISYQLIHPDQLPPRDYRITFRGLSSIVRIDSDMLPVFAETHMMEIHLPGGFPAEAPICYMISEIWHPNIQSDEGPYLGRICGNTEGFGAYYSVDELILRIQAMLRWEIYHAELRFPYPEDENVARWVREYAEPLGIVKPGVGLIPHGAVPDDWKRHVRKETRQLIKMKGGDHE